MPPNAVGETENVLAIAVIRTTGIWLNERFPFSILQNSNQYYSRGIGVVKNLEDVANITVKTVDGTPVKVGDVKNKRRFFI